MFESTFTVSTDRPAWRRFVWFAFGLLLLIALPAIVRAQDADTVVVSWTAPGDDGNAGTATTYDLRVSEQPITQGNFDNALVVPQVPAPLEAGSRQTVVVRGLQRDRTYYFAMRTADNQGNWSGLSNLVRFDWTLDTSPPSAPRHVRAERDGDRMRVRWDSNAEADLAGYNVYRRVAGGAQERLNASLVIGSDFLDVDPAATGMMAYTITAVDQRGNESAASATVTASLVAIGGWELRSSYPNPSRLADAVHFPVVVPSSVSGDLRIEILDSGGRPVRRIVVSSPQPGLIDVVWDGRNDAGKATAPGVYRGWLIAGDVRTAVKLLRAP